MIRHCCASIILLATITNGALAANSARTIVVVGMQAPGTPAGVVFESIVRGAINNDGDVAFDATLRGTGGAVLPPNADSGIWGDDGSTLRKIAREGDVVPGAPGNAFLGFSSPLIDADGLATFTSFTSVLSLYQEAETGFRLVAAEGQQAPGLPIGVKFDSVQFPVMSKGGNFIVFQSQLDDPLQPALDRSFWLDANGARELIVREGDAAPEIPGAVISFPGNYAANDQGGVLFGGAIEGPGLVPSSSATWYDDGSGPQLLLKTGDPAPGLPSGITFRQGFGDLNDSGQIVIEGLLAGPGINDFNDSVIYLSDQNGLTLIASDGAPAAGLPAGVTYGQFFQALINDAGEIALAGNIGGAGVNESNDSAIWIVRNGVPKLIAREGDPAPGAGPGVMLGELANLFDVNGFLFNEAGQIVFESYVFGDAVTPANLRGIWATDANDQLQLVLRRGDLFDVNDDPAIEDLRTIGDTFNFPVQLRRNSLNDVGQLVVALTFTDSSSGLFVVNTIIPEPSSVITALAAYCLLIKHRRGQHRLAAA